MTEIIKETPQYRLILHWNERVLEYEVRTFIPSDKYRQMIREMQALLKKHHINKLLSVLQEAQVIAKSDQDWFVQHIVPQLQKDGLASVAVVPPSSVFGQAAFGKVIEELGIKQDGIQRKRFMDKHSAMQWLMNQ